MTRSPFVQADSQLKSIAQAKAEGGGDVTLARLRGDVKVAEDATETMRKVFQEKQGVSIAVVVRISICRILCSGGHVLDVSSQT